MSTSKDLIAAAKDAREVYKAAKELGKQLDQEAEIAAAEIESLKELQKQLVAVARSLPTEMTLSERRALIRESKKLVKERIKHQEAVMDFEELAKLHAQIFILNTQELKLRLLDSFDPRRSVAQEPLDKLLEDVRAAQREVKARMKTRGYVKIAAKTAILMISLGVLVAKAAG